MNWAFVDYENVGSLEAVNLSDYARVFVFCGPNNTRIKVGPLPSNGFCGIELIGVPTTGSNNLDFHLAFHLGRFHELAEKGVTFHIISNDAGFNGLANHLTAIGRTCTKIAPKQGQPKKHTTLPLGNEATLVVSRLQQLDGRKRPRKKEGLLNWIKSQCQGLMNGTPADTVFNELIKAELVRSSGSDVSYDIEHWQKTQSGSAATEEV